MAIAGDIIIKLAADFAQFAEGMLQSTKSLEDFGKQAEKTSASIQSAIGWLKGLAGTAAVTWVVSKVTAYTDAIDQQALAVAKLQKQYKLSAIEVQALQGEVDKTGKSFAELAEHAGKNPKWLDSIVLDARAAGTALDEGVIRSISDMDAKSAEATKKINAMFAPFYANTKATALENIANTLSGIIDMMNRAANHVGFWSKMGSLFSGGMIRPDGTMGEKTQTERDAEDIENAAKRITKAQADIAAAVANGANNPRHDAVRAAELAAAQEEMRRAQNAATLRGARSAGSIVGNTETSVPFVPDLPVTTVTGSRGGGGGGRTDNESIEAQIKRYEALAAVALRTGETISKNRQKNIDDLQREVRVQQQVEEIAAKLGAKYADADPALQKRLREEILLYEQRKDAAAQFLEDLKKAQEIDIKYGDGVRAKAQLERDLTKARDAGVASVEALARVEKERSEGVEQQRLMAKRFDDNAGSLTAGFQYAANSYARANDMFTQGGQLFSATTAAMGEGLDVLLGKSTKTFGQIAADFATMLTKMAIQASLSKVFELVFKSLGFGGSTGITMTRGPSTPLPTATARAGGGDVYGGQPYWVGEYGPERFVPAGAGRIEPAGGGDVYVAINNYTDSKVSAQKSKGANGQMQIAVIVEAVEGQMAQRMSRGQGALGKTIEESYGLQRVGR